MTVDVGGDRDLFERASSRLGNMRPVMEAIGHYEVGQAQYRLTQVLKPDAEVRTGDLQNSLTVFDVTDDLVTFGSNLVYAAQVHFGGTIEPKPGGAKALAIPLLPSLQRYHLGPLDLDPGRELLQFVPYTGGKPNVFGLLVNPKDKQVAGYPPGPLFALARWVTQEPRPYLYIDDADVAEIAEMVGEYLVGD